MKKSVCLLVYLILVSFSCHLLYAAEPDKGIVNNKTVSGNDAADNNDTVSGNDAADNNDTVSGNDILPLTEDLISLEVPGNLDFIMDPLQLCGRGQIYSKEFYFSNWGSRAIRVNLTDIKCTLSEGIKAAEADGTEEAGDIMASPDRVIHLQMLFEEGEAITVLETPGEYEFVLEPGQRLGFQITGSMSENPSPFWKTGDVAISLIYSVDSVEKQ